MRDTWHLICYWKVKTKVVDQNLCFKPLIKKFVKSWFYHWRNIDKAKSFISHTFPLNLATFTPFLVVLLGNQSNVQVAQISAALLQTQSPKIWSSLRFSVKVLLTLPKSGLKTKGDTTSALRAPSLWNNRPEEDRLAESVTCFISLLKKKI